MYNAYLLMLKLVYPFGSKTSKVLSNCVVKVGGHDLGSNVTHVYITYNTVYLIASERHDTHTRL